MKVVQYTPRREGLDDENLERMADAMREITETGDEGGLFCAALVMVHEVSGALETRSWDFCKEGFEPVMLQAHLERVMSLCLGNLLDFGE